MKKGFTLIELSIVLVIIGLLIGGILIAKSMISSAKVQSIVRQIQQHEIAVNNFKATYNYYPGDAPMFIPAGNGDNRIGCGGLGCLTQCSGVYQIWDESVNVFAHLSQASMIKGDYAAFQPITCGGTHNNLVILTEGLVAPYTELDSKAQTAMTAFEGLSAAKMPIFSMGDYFPFALTYRINAEYVIPIETKLGVSDIFSLPNGSTGGKGLVNESGAGNCISTIATTVSCTNSLAGYGIIDNFMLN